MPYHTNFSFTGAFAATTGKSTAIPLILLDQKRTEKQLKKAPAPIRKRAEQSGFTGKQGQILVLYDSNGAPEVIWAGVNAPLRPFDLSAVAEQISRIFTSDSLKSLVFTLDNNKMKAEEIQNACLGWGLASYRFDFYKTGKGVKKQPPAPRLLWPANIDRKSVIAHLDSAALIRTLINIPANDLGPEELEDAAKLLAEAEGAKISIIKDKALLKNNLPMIHAVGHGSTRRPRLIDLQWGKATHPKLTLVGKGVCFDTGGLDLKPSSAMLMMKKDMGGAAHALGLALLIIRHKLPVRLRVLIPAVENSVSGDAFRPWDVLTSRKGITVEVGNTDAEGRLVLADALTLACEEKPDFIVDFATLTGAARVALGVELPAVFSNREKLGFDLATLGIAQDDPLWPLPLWQDYRKEMTSDIADISSTGSGKAGAITAALFLESFVDPDIDWVHLDIYAWDHGGKSGKSKGGTEMTSRAVFAYLQKRYGTA